MGVPHFIIHFWLGFSTNKLSSYWWFQRFVYFQGMMIPTVRFFETRGAFTHSGTYHFKKSVAGGCYIWVCLKMSCKPLKPMVLLIIIPFLNGYFIGKINPIFRQSHLGHFQVACVSKDFVGLWHRGADGFVGRMSDVSEIDWYHIYHIPLDKTPQYKWMHNAQFYHLGGLSQMRASPKLKILVSWCGIECLFGCQKQATTRIPLQWP